MSKNILRNLNIPLTIELILENCDPISVVRSKITIAIEAVITKASKTNQGSLK